MTSAIDPKFLSDFRRIQILTAHLAEDVLAGAYRSAFKGKGMEFEEVRAYQQGDEVRSIDWNVTARMGHPYVKNFREERELTVLLVVDISASEKFGTREELKNQWIAEIGAVLAFSAIKNQDKVGVLLFSDQIELYLQPKKGLRHVLRIIRELLYFKPRHKGSNLAAALSFVGKVHRRASVCFILSDFLCPPFEHELSLIAQHHDIIAISFTDRSEKQFPPFPLASVQDLETGERKVLDMAKADNQAAFAENSLKRKQALKTLIHKNKGGLIEIDGSKPYVESLKHFFKSRGKPR